MNDELHQSDANANPAIEIAVLRERLSSMGREMREMKDTQQRELKLLQDAQARLGEKLDAILTVMSEARGGWRTLMLVGGMSTTVGAAVSWAVTHIFK